MLNILDSSLKQKMFMCLNQTKQISIYETQNQKMWYCKINKLLINLL